MKRSIPIKQMLTICVLAIFCLVMGSSVLAQEQFPKNPINFIIGLPAGSSPEIVCRPLCNAVSKMLGQPIVIVQKPGAGQAIGLVTLKDKEPNGYHIGTLLSGTLYGQYMRKVPYDVVKDFTPIIQIGAFQQGLLVRPDSPWKTFEELINYAKTNPGKIRFGISGTGQVNHLVLERLTIESGAKWVIVPLGGEQDAISNLLGGHVEAICTSAIWSSYVDAGKLRLLAVVGAGEKRMPMYPNAPALLDLGYKITAPSFFAIAGPKGLPNPIVDILHKSFKRAMDDQDFIKAMAQLNYPIIYRGPEEFRKYLSEMNEEVAMLFKKLGIQKEQ